MKTTLKELWCSQMINVKIDPSSEAELFAEVNKKIDGIRELTTSYTQKELMDTAFSIAALKFVKTTNMYARSNKSAFHHVYEWQETGKESGRLFRIIKRNASAGSATIYTKFNNSKKQSPIAPVLKNPGATGAVVKRSGVFKDKANVMEAGKPVQFITTRTIAFSPDKRSIVFVPPGKTISIRNPGGNDVKGSFGKHFISWWNINFPTILDDSGVILNIQKNVARALNRKGAGRSSVREAIFRSTSAYKTVGSVI